MTPRPDQLPPPLLRADDPLPVRSINASGASRFLLVADHAGNRVPAALGTLGVGDADRARHIGWDIGIAALVDALAARIDAHAIAQVYSRLVVDCNRAPGAPDAIPAVSDGTAIPANAGLSESDRAARVAAVHTPYHQAIADAVAARDAAGRPSVLIALHSFTPVMRGVARPWHVGLLHHLGDTRPARFLLNELARDPMLCVGDNQPYAMDGIDYTIPRHAGLTRPYAEIEVRQDLIANAHGQAEWADRLATILLRWSGD